MSLPDRTLCWVEGPPQDRYCTPVQDMTPAELFEAEIAITIEREREAEREQS